MDNFNTLSVDNKPVKYAFLNSRLIYTSLINSSTPNWALENTTLSAVGGYVQGGYYPPGDTTWYNCWFYATTPTTWRGDGSGSNHLFPIAPHVWCRAKHYDTTLTSFYGKSGTYTVNEQIGLVDWARANKHEDLLPDSDVSDIEMIESNEAFLSDDIPYLMPWKQY